MPGAGDTAELRVIVEGVARARDAESAGGGASPPALAGGAGAAPPAKPPVIRPPAAGAAGFSGGIPAGTGPFAPVLSGGPPRVPIPAPPPVKPPPVPPPPPGLPPPPGPMPGVHPPAHFPRGGPGSPPPPAAPALPMNFNRPAPPEDPRLEALVQRQLARIRADSLEKLTTAATKAAEAVKNFAVAMMDPQTDPARPFRAAGKNMEEFGTAAIEAGTGLVLLGQPIGIAVAGFGLFNKMLGIATGALGELMDAAHGMAERFGEFDPGLARELALADVRQVFGDIRRAREAGPELSRFTLARSQLQQTIEDQKVRFMNKALPLLTTAVGALDKLVTFGSAGLEAFFNNTGLGQQIAAHAAGVLAATQALLGIAVQNQADDFQTPTDLILGQQFPQNPFFTQPPGPAARP